MLPLLPPVIPEGHPGLGRFPEVLVLKGVLEGSITITLEANEPAKAIDISLIFSFVIPAKAGIQRSFSSPLIFRLLPLDSLTFKYPYNKMRL